MLEARLVGYQSRMRKGHNVLGERSRVQLCLVSHGEELGFDIKLAKNRDSTHFLFKDFSGWWMEI
jgi:hypothetical protein